MNAISTNPPAWFRIVAVLAVLWNCVGVYFYLLHVGAVPGPEMSAEEQAAMAMLPAWSTAAFAVGVFAGLLGSLGLLLAKSWSRLLLLLSLLALIALEGWFVFMTDAVATMGPSTYVMPALIVGIAILLVWVASTAAKRGWLS